MKRVVVLILIIALVIGAAIAFASRRDGEMPFEQNKQNTQDTTPEASRPGSTSPDSTNTASKDGTYKEYSDQAVTNADGSVWIFFHAPWCPQCRALELDIQQRGVPSGLTILKTDYDSSTQLRQKYGVTLQTTVVRVDKQGNELGKFVAYDDPTLTAVADALGM